MLHFNEASNFFPLTEQADFERNVKFLVCLGNSKPRLCVNRLT